MTPRGEDQQAAREARLDELHDKLTTAVDQLVSGEDWKRALAFAANFRSRSFNNTLLIWAQHAAAYERGLVPKPTPSVRGGVQTVAGPGPPGPERPARLSDHRTGHWALCLGEPAGCRVVAQTRQVREAAAR